MDANPDQLVVVGTIIKPHGISGEVAVESHCDSPGFFEPGRRVFILRPEQGFAPLEIIGARNHQGRVLLRFDGISSRTEAETIKRLDLYIEKSLLSVPAPGEYYYYEIIGARVLDSAGQTIGRVEGIVESGSQRSISIRTAAGEFLVPFVDDYIQEVRPEPGEIVIRNYQDLARLDGK